MIKGFKQGTKVLMFDGSFKKVEELSIGDFLMGVDSQKREVLNIKMCKAPVIEIEPKKGEKIYITESQEIVFKYIPKKKKKDSEINKYIKAIDYLNFTQRKRRDFYLFSVGVDFNQKGLLIDPYYMGLWLGDGQTSDPTRVYNIDEEIINYLRNHAVSLGMVLTKNGISYSTTTGKRGFRAVGENQIRNSFKIYGLNNLKFIPEDFKINSRENRLKLLAGLIDSDGSKDRKNNIVIINLKLESLVDDIEFLSKSLGFSSCRSSFLQEVGKENKKRVEEYYRIIISGNLSEIPTIVKRKTTLKEEDKRKKGLRTGVRELKTLKEENCVEITVSDDNLFILSDFTVVCGKKQHNDE